MAQVKVLGGQLDIVDVSAELAADSTAIGNLATGILADPGATATFDADYIRRDGTNAMTAAFDAGNNLLSNVTDPSGAQDAATKNYVDSNFLDLAGTSAMTGNLNLDGNDITNVDDIALTTVNGDTPLLSADIGSTVQAWDADLDDVAGLTHSGGEVIYSNGGTWASAGPGATSGVQGYDADLDAIAALSPSTGDVLSYTPAGWVVNRDGTATVGFPLNLVAGDAFATSGADGGSVTLQAGAGDGAGADGIISVQSDMVFGGSMNLDMGTGDILQVANINVNTINSVAIGDYLVVSDIGVSVQGYSANLAQLAAAGHTGGEILWSNGGVWNADAPGATSGVQPYDAGLASIAGLTTAADTMIYTTALDTYATTSLTSFARTLLDDADAATARGTLGATDDTTVAGNHYTKTESDAAPGASGAKIDKVSGAASNNLASHDGSGGLVDSGIAQGTVLVSGDLGTTVQDWDANLDTIAAISPADGQVMVGSSSDWVASGRCRMAEFAVGTTDATPTDLATLGIPADGAITVTFRAHGFEAATGDTISEVIHASAKQLSGTSSAVGTPTPGHAAADAGAAGWSFGIVVDDPSDTIKLVVTGEAAHTISWSCCAEWTEA